MPVGYFRTGVFFYFLRQESPSCQFLFITNLLLFLINSNFTPSKHAYLLVNPLLMMNFKRIAIKVGSNVLTNGNGSLNQQQIQQIVEQIVSLRQQQVEVILISSGAVAAGKCEVQLSKKTDIIRSKQVWAALGQARLISLYTQLFAEHQLHCAQVLTTKESFSDRRHYLNMQNCMLAMLDNQIIPIVNENDTVSVTELMFTDNDELSGLIASMLQCEALFILSNIDGVYTGNPSDVNTQLIQHIDENSADIEQYIAPTRSDFGRGGMLTKCNIARKISLQGIDVFIANGKREGILEAILQQKEVPFTHFKATREKTKSVKSWLAHSDTFAKGTVTINPGAEEALLSQEANSLLHIGITAVNGHFEKGDIVKILNEQGQALAVGRAKVNAEKAEQLKGKKHTKPFIHYDYLSLLRNVE